MSGAWTRTFQTVAGLACLGVLVAGCSGSGDTDSAGDASDSAPTSAATTSTGQSSSTPSPTKSSSPTPTMQWEKGTTKPGTTMAVGKKAEVRFKTGPKHNSLVAITVDKVRRGDLKDLSEFKVPEKVQRSSIYYVNVTVKNVGNGDLSGEQVKLYGKVSKNTVVQPATFTGGFKKCTNEELPKKFTKGEKAETCLVFFAPHHGKISEIQWRFDKDDLPPVSWRVNK